MTKVKQIIISILMAICVLFIVSCDSDKVEEHTHTYDETWSYDANNHFHQCTFKNCTATYKLGRHQYDEDDVCKICGYVKGQMIGDITSFTVIFNDADGGEINKQTVTQGSSAVAPKNPTKEGYVFAGWDKSFDNVTSDLIINPVFTKLKDSYNISYSLGDGSWSYANKTDMVLAFLKDFYEFVNPTESLSDFIYDSEGKYLGSWSTYVGGKVGKQNYLLKDNDVTLDDNNYFFNSESYKAKWSPLAIYVRDEVCKQNQRFGTKDYYYGILDFYRYIINDPVTFIDIYGGESIFYGYPEFTMTDLLENYAYGDQTYILPKPLSNQFLYWVDQYGNKISEIKPYACLDYELTAQWNNNQYYTIHLNTNGGKELDDVTIKSGQTIELETPIREGYIFTGWYMNDEKFTLEKYIYEFDITLEASWRGENEVELENLVYDGANVTYRKSTEVVKIPTTYVQKKAQLRACWVSSFAGDFEPSTDQETMKKNLTEILDVMDAFNMNCMIFHIRTHNQAFYKTKMTYIASEYGTYETFEEWDYLTWLISECHKRGIEFHAWLNPYRLVSEDATSLEEVAEKWKNYPNNPASDPDNMLMNSSGNVILNPAIPEVRDYIVDICVDIMENYDVDAIHFDDYFYIKGIDDSASIKKYNTSGLSTDNFRREQVNLFIEQLSDTMHEFNVLKDRHVQLGISPTGIYKNGDGSLEKGSNTSGYAHYGSPLYADTYKWIKNNWIDYIMPQSYWGFTLKSAPYADVMDWWNLAVAGTKVNLYSGIGLYMSVSYTSAASWSTQPYEVSNQVLYTTKLENCQGLSFYKFKSLQTIYEDESSIQYKGVMRLKNEYWTEKVPTPSTMATTHDYDE